MRGEQDLIRTLRTAADQVEQVDLARGVAARRHARRIRQRVRMALAAAAAVAIAGGTTAALSVASGSERRAEEQWTQVEERWPQVEKRWPQAVAKVSARTAGGARILPLTGLSPAEVLLLVAAPAKGKPSRLDVYDLTRRTTRTLAQVPAIKGKEGPDGVTAGPGHIAWYATTGGTTTFWAVPRTGGTATRVATTSGEVAVLGVMDDSLVWSSWKGGVHRVPLTGGTPSRLPGSDGLRLTSWPWAARLGKGVFDNQDRAVDLETGRSFDVRAPKGTRFLRCGPRWCAGELNGRLLVQRVDGTGRRKLPELRLYSPRQPYADRYVLAAPATPRRTGEGPLAVLHDLETGTTIGLGEQRPGTLGTPIAVSKSSSATILHWDEDAQPPETCAKKTCAPMTLGRKEWTVLNLLALTR
ncbi:hypothetical protein SMD20_31265 [Nonomuraea sp. LP-02]|uniref:hypothetical protein n=1 Tax=Nonomuraea sp. LP-02 TaxID=3097960 RepID=UPI002E37F4BE|nr:hypothetical protein [Nonomuraea sp. LP-02]MED7928765.1 hypothetical protein [Nonomuraea sp. LP-02]